MPSSKFYSQKEISEILTKASEIQLKKDHQEIQKKGLSKEELLEIANEAGISQASLELAIRNYENRTHSNFNWLTGNSELKASMEIDSEVTKLQLDQLFPELNAFTGQKGEVEIIGNSYDWEQIENSFETIRRVTIFPKGGKTKVTQYVNWNDLKFLGLPLSTIMGAVLLMIILKAAGLPKTSYLFLSIFGGVFGYFGFMAGLKYFFKSQKQKFESIMHLIQDVLSRPAQHRIGMEEQYKTVENESNQGKKN